MVGSLTDRQRWKADMDIRWMFWHHQSRSENLGPDELEHLAVGDPDPTSDSGTANRYRRCRFEWTDTTSQTLILRWSCTREWGHQGQHVAGTGEWVTAVHPQPLRYRVATSHRIPAPTSNTPWPAPHAARPWVMVLRDRLTAGRPSQLPC
jgi:hypothetical protein